MVRCEWFLVISQSICRYQKGILFPPGYSLVVQKPVGYVKFRRASSDMPSQRELRFMASLADFLKEGENPIFILVTGNYEQDVRVQDTKISVWHFQR